MVARVCLRCQHGRVGREHRKTSKKDEDRPESSRSREKPCLSWERQLRTEHVTVSSGPMASVGTHTRTCYAPTHTHKRRNRRQCCVGVQAPFLSNHLDTLYQEAKFILITVLIHEVMQWPVLVLSVSLRVHLLDWLAARNTV